MPTLYIICGLPGSGKTTLAKQMEADSSAIRMCPDEWIQDILPPDYSREELDRLRDPVENLQWKLAERLLSIGVDVIIEWGTWGKSERENLRDKARQLGAKAALHYLEVPLEELIRRVEMRNANLPDGDFYLSTEEIKECFAIFQAPDEEEMKTYDFSKKWI